MLADFLEFAVPVEMARLADATDEQLRHLADTVREDLAFAGDVAQFRGSGTAASAARVVTALAVLALTAQGGVTAFGHHWCRDDDDTCPNRAKEARRA